MFGRISSTLGTLLAMQEAMDSAMKSDYFETATASRGGYPPINLFQKGENTIMTVEIPGVKKEDIRIEIKDKLIRLSGRRKINYPEKASVHRLERKNRKFDRTIKLPFSANVEKAKAGFNNGILSVTLPRMESEKPKLIRVS